MQTLSKIIKTIENKAPLNLQESWDNSGLQIGSRKNEIKKVLTCLDVDEEAVEEAIAQGCDLILSHHPLFFRGLKKLDFDTAKGKILKKIIENNISVYSAHTSLDKADEGLNTYIATLLELKDLKPLRPDGINSRYYKLAVYLPEEQQETFMKLFDQLELGSTGENYEICTFQTKGTGSFRPTESANPSIGKPGRLEKVKEIRLETIVKKDRISAVLDSLKRAHPYEEMAYDLFPVELPDLKIKEGLGTIGKLERRMTPEEFVSFLKERLEVDHLREAGPRPEKVRRVAICTGAGSDLILTAKSRKADVFITGDLKYHEAQLAKEEKLWILDAGHFGTEKKVAELLKSFLSGIDVEVITDNRTRDYINII